MQRLCAQCSNPHERRGSFCSDACRSRAYRRRKAGLDESAYPRGARRGRVALGELSERERSAYKRAIRVGRDAATVVRELRA